MILTPNIETRDSLFLIAGTTPGFNVGDNKYTNIVSDDNSSLIGWDIEFTIRTIGEMNPATEYSITDEVVQLSDPNYHTVLGEIWVLNFQPKSQTAPPVGNTAISWSNGYNVPEVLAALLGRRRWRQPVVTPDYPMTLESDLVWATGDEFSPVFESGHAVVTVNNIYDVQENNKITSAQFSQVLRRMAIDNVLKCLTNVFNKTEQLEKALMFERFGRQDYSNANQGVFCAVRIIPAQSFGKSVRIEKLILLFNQAKTFNFYLFHDTQPGSPVATFSVTTITGEQTIIPLDYVISYAGSGNKSGAYYLGYFQNDLGTALATNEIIGQFNKTYNFGLTPVVLPNPAATTIDVNQVSFTMKSQGFNIQVSSFRDYTQLIVDNAHILDNVMEMQMAADVIELVNNSSRTNIGQRIIKEVSEKLYLDLNIAQATQENPFGPGLKTRIFREYARVRNEFFPKKKNISITHDTEKNNVYGVYPPLMDGLTY